jgi:uncharacterized protein YkwD
MLAAARFTAAGEIGYPSDMTSPPSLPRVIAILLPLVLCAACSGNTTATDGPSQANPLDTEEAAVITALNMVRTAAGAPMVTQCTSLNTSASAHSDDMRDNDYLSDVPPSNPASTVRSRGCAAGYTPACTGTIPMAELVAQGYGTGGETVTQWQMDMTAGPILVEKSFTVAGVGRSQGADNEWWSLDLASDACP